MDCSPKDLHLARLVLLLLSPLLALAVLLVFVGLSVMLLFEGCSRACRARFQRNRSTSTR